MTVESLIPQLTAYQDAGTKYLQASKTVSDLQGMKRSLYLSKKAPALIDKIVANASAIATMQDEITTQLTQFETFLQDLKDKYGDLTSTTTQATTGQTDFLTSE